LKAGNSQCIHLFVTCLQPVRQIVSLFARLFYGSLFLRYRKTVPIVAAFLVLLVTSSLLAQTKGNATFGGLKNLEFVDNYYNGGTGSMGSGPPARNLNLTFTSNAQTIISAAKKGSGNFIGNPGGYPVMFFSTGTSVMLNSSGGVATALWFSYSALQPGAVTVYDGPNGTGNILANITLPANNVGCTTYKLCIWSPIGIPLATPAGSLRFSGVANYLAIATIHFGAKIPTSIVLTSSPNPSTVGQAVTITAAVAVTGAAPAGTVRFKRGNVVLGEVPVVGGVASITVSTLPPGSTKLSAIFRGAGFVTSTGTTIQTVN